MSVYSQDVRWSFEVRWKEEGRNKSLRVHGAYELARKIERKKMCARDGNRHLDIKREVNFRILALIDRAKILGRSNIKMTERDAKLARQHIARTGSTAREIWKQMEETCDKANVG